MRFPISFVLGTVFILCLANCVNLQSTSMQMGRENLKMDSRMSEQVFKSVSLNRLRAQIDVAEGIYKVRLGLKAKGIGARVSIFAEANRRMIHDLQVPEFGVTEAEFIVEVRSQNLKTLLENAPGSERVKLFWNEANSPDWDDVLTIDVVGAVDVLSVDLDRLDVGNVPTVLLAGDSTVANQPHPPAHGWGQELPSLLGSKVLVSNHAASGETLKSFQTSLRFAKLLENVSAGDYVLIQFGHNDQKVNWPQTYSAPDTTYPAYLQTFLVETRERGGIPVLVTSLERFRLAEDGKIKEGLTEYAEAVRTIAYKDNTALIDLNAYSIELYESVGEEGERLLFSGGGDVTHTSAYGAYAFARFVALELSRLFPNEFELKFGVEQQSRLLTREELRLIESDAPVKRVERGN